jgi:hypothetical protein
MSKYQFHRLGSDTFQEMVQSLLEVRRRDLGGLIQFSSAGADGAREATWTQPINHPDYVRPPNSAADVPKQWVFQVKFHDIGLRGWAGAGAAVVADLKAELEKVTNKYKHACHHYVLITNVPLTGASRIGTRDKVMKVADDWKTQIPCVEVWDAADLSRMLDNNPSVRTAYDELILPGDILKALYGQIQFQADRKEATFRGYLKYLVDNESKARAEEAGDDDPLSLVKVFIDQTLQLDKQSIPDCYRADVETWAAGAFVEDGTSSLLPEDLDEVSSAFPLLWGAQEKVMLLAGPGYGKSTITQFLALYHAGRIIDRTCASALARRLKLPSNWTPEDLDAACTMRFPFRVELRRYAKWRKSQVDDSTPIGIASYIARQLIGGSVESTLNQDDIFGLIATNPTLLILDGLDEVPNKDDRELLLKDFDAFLYRCSGEDVDLQIVMSSRPQGYHGEFDRFQPLRWVINDLTEKDFYQYSADWLNERIKNSEERKEAEERIKRGMASDSVRRLATTLLQATVMLTIVRKKSDIPEERHKLFEKYVQVVFDREKSKNDLIARHENELMLLHEMIGYQIHEGVARGEAGVMPEAKFKELVWYVWRLIRGSDQIKDSPNQEIQRICELSTDRLVFLSGKGTNQSDIDFVIQPYREYFAANYLANHTNSDPDKVFKCLVERGPYWQQVLRFFAAITTQAQRQSWAFSSAATVGGGSDLDELVRELPARRAVLFSLPEFSRLQFEPFRKIISGCLPEREWWTWLGQGWVIPIIAGLRGGDGWRELWRAFKGIEIHGYGSKEFALLLFPRVIASDSAEFPDLLQFVSTSLSDTVLARRAIEASVYHELPVDLSLANEETLFEVLQMFPHRRGFHQPAAISNLLNRLPRHLALRFLCTFPHRYYGMNEGLSVWEFMGFPVREKPVAVLEMERAGETTIAIVPPSWLEFAIHGQPQLTNKSDPEGIFATYIGALFESLQSPDDPSLYQKAVHAMSVLGEKLAWPFRCECVLGPSPDRFESISDWIYYKAEMRLLFSKTEDTAVLYDLASSFGGTPGTVSNAWTTLLFYPTQWDSLISEGLVESEFIATLSKSKWAMLAGAIKEPVELATVVQYSPLPKVSFNIPFLKVMRIAIELHNRGDLKETTIAGKTLALARVEKTSVDEFHDLIRAVQNPSRFPVSWARALVEVALSTEGINLGLVADFWAALNSERKEPIWLRLMPHTASEQCHAIVADLMKLGSDAALELSVLIASRGMEVLPEVSNEMNRRAASGLLSGGLSDARKRTLVRCLLRSRPTLEEAKLYGAYQAFKEVTCASPHSESQMVERLNSMPQILKKEEFSSLRVELNRLLSHKEEYSPEISAAALDALIQLDVASCAPISETDWQVGS